MSKELTIPCCRNLTNFKKKGCPEMKLDRATGKGCKYWKIRRVPTGDSKDPFRHKGACMDEWTERWGYEALGLLEGNQQATERFRNGMCQQGKGGKVYPKPDPGVLALVSTLQQAMSEWSQLPAVGIVDHRKITP